jgi:hypothetical protein
MPKPDSAKYLWFSREDRRRNVFAMFRRSFELGGDVVEAKLHLFADTAYQLFVNGEFVEFGPVRFDPRYPLYDTHDISRLLSRGRNVVAVLANYYGHKTYKAMSCQAGMVAWGEVKLAGGRAVSLESRPDLWRCMPAGAYRFAPKVSFALNAADLYDQSREETGWKERGFDDSHWGPAVELADQNAWGALAPRAMPFMSGRPLDLGRVLSVRPLHKHEQWFSFSVSTPHVYEDNASEYSSFVAFTTWVHSPRKQTTHVGVFWSESWLNGQPLERGVDCIDRPMRITQRWELKKGWNHLFGKVRAYQDILDMYFALPLAAGLTLSADQKPGSACIFRHSPLLTAEEFERHLKNKPLPYAADEVLAEVGGWVAVPREWPAQSPCRETSWDTHGEPIETLEADGLAGHVFRRVDYPDGFMVLLDLGHIHLCLPQVRLHGVNGATVDLTYSEHLMPDGQHLRHAHNYSGGDRVLCSRDMVDFMPTSPRGMRYVKLTVRNAPGDVVLEEFGLRSASYPVRETGRFRCSDALLNAVWEMGKRTQAVNMEDAYVDCVGRERGMYLRDTILQYHSNLAAFGDQALMARCMQLYGQSPDATGKFRAVYPNSGDYTIADFALNGLEGYRAYYEHTGDAERIRADWDAMMKNLAWFHTLADERDDLLLDSEWDTKKGVKAHYGGFHGDLSIVKGHMDNSGVHCVFSCTYLIAMQAAVVLGRAIGKTDDVAALEKRIAAITPAIRDKFWDAKARCFGDNLDMTTHSVHASLFAARAGVASGEQLAGVREHVAAALKCIFVNGYDPSAGTLTSPNFAFYILDGLYRVGLAKTAEDLMRDGWGWALAQGLKTCPEYWTLGASQCHAWSAGPTYYLSKYALGVHFPAAPDLSKVEIRVQADTISEAEGAWPHPLGVIEVKWHTETGKRVFDYVKAPKGVSVTVVG